MKNRMAGKTWLKIAIAVVVLVMLAEALLIWNYAPKKPFENIQKEDISAIYVMTSESKKFAVEEDQWSDAFLRYLQEVTLYGRIRQDGTVQHLGSPIILRVELKNGKTYMIQPADCIAIVNGKGYETNYYSWSFIDSFMQTWWLENVD